MAFLAGDRYRGLGVDTVARLWAAAMVERDTARQEHIEKQTLARDREKHRVSIGEYDKCRELGLVGSGWRAIGRNMGYRMCGLGTT